MRILQLIFPGFTDLEVWTDPLCYLKLCLKYCGEMGNSAAPDQT